jgi:hypothetical protein
MSMKLASAQGKTMKKTKRKGIRRWGRGTAEVRSTAFDDNIASLLTF